MTTYSRDIEIERAEVDLDTGKIASVPVFTGGEATDGHILNIHGAKKPKDMPWFVQHEADPRTQLGTLYSPRIDGDSILYDGEILSEGDGAAAEVRRDLLLKIARGHVKRLSGKWDADPKHVTPRVNLPKDHPAYVDDAKANDRQRYGLYFDKWTPMEGSIVGLGADPAAKLREWAEDEESTDAVRGFWREQADAYDAEQQKATPDEPTEEAKQAAALASVRSEFQQAVDLGVEMPEILREVGAVAESSDDTEDLGVDEPTEPEADEDLIARIISLEERLDALDSSEPGRVEDDDPPASPERVEADPLSATLNLDLVTQAKLIRASREERLSPLDVANMIRDGIAEDRRDADAKFLEKIEKLRGRVT
jgi:hypothetical protein